MPEPAPEAPRAVPVAPKRRKRGCILKGVGIALLALILGVVALVYLFPSQTLRRHLELMLRERTGRACTIGNLKVDLWHGGFAALDVVVPASSSDQEPFLTAKEVTMVIHLPAFLRGQFDMRRLMMDGVELSLQRDATGRWNDELLFLLFPSQERAHPAGAPVTPLPLPLIPETQTPAVAPTLSVEAIAAPAMPVAVDIGQVELKNVRLRVHDSMRGRSCTAELPHATLTSQGINTPIAVEAELRFRTGAISGAAPVTVPSETEEAASILVKGQVDLFDGYRVKSPQADLDATVSVRDLAGLLAVVGVKPKVDLAVGSIRGTIGFSAKPEGYALRTDVAITDVAVVPVAAYPLTFPGENRVRLSVASDTGWDQLAGQAEVDMAQFVVKVEGSVRGREGVGDLQLDGVCKVGALLKQLANVDGLLGGVRIAGPVRWRGGVPTAELDLSAAQLGVRSSRLLKEEPLGLLGKLVLEPQGLRLHQLALTALGTALRVDGIVGWQSLVPLFSLTLTGQSDQAALAKAFRPGTLPHHMSLHGLMDIEGQLRSGDKQPIRFLASVRAADGETVYLTRSDESSPLRVNLGRLRLEAGGETDLSGNALLEQVRFESDPLTLLASGSVQGALDQASGQYRLEVSPGKAAQALLTVLPRQLVTTVESLRGEGAFNYVAPWLTLQNTSLSGVLRIDNAAYPMTMAHDVRAALDGKSGFALNRVTFSMTQDEALVLEAAAAGMVQQKDGLLQGRVQTQTRGNAALAAGLVESLFGVTLPDTNALSAEADLRGLLDLDGAATRMHLGLQFKNLRLSRQGQTWLQDARVTGEARLSYRQEGKVTLETLSLATSDNALYLHAEGGAEAGADANWSFTEGSNLTVKGELGKFPALFPDMQAANVNAHGKPVLRMRLSGRLVEANLEGDLSGAETLVASPAYGPRPVQLKSLNGAFTGTLNLEDDKRDLLVLNNLNLTTDFAQVRANGRLSRFAADETAYHFGDGTFLAVKADVDGGKYAQAVPYPLSGVHPDVKLGAGRVAATLRILPDVEKAKLQTWHDWMTVLLLQDATAQLSEMNIDGRPVQNLQSDLSLQDGVLSLKNLKGQFGGYIWSRADMDFKPVLTPQGSPALRPACTVLVATSGLSLPAVLGDVSRYCRFTDGKLFLPDAEIAKSAQAQWSGFGKSDILSTLAVSNGSLVIQDLTMLMQDKTTNWSDWMKYDFPVDLGETSARPAGAEYDAQTKTLTKEIRYASIKGRYQIADRLVTLQDVEILGDNTADFLVEGSSKLDPEQIMSSSLDLKVYLISHVSRTLPVDDLFSSLKEFDKIPESQREGLKDDLIALLEDLGRSRKLYVFFRGTLQSPRPDATKLAKTLASEVGKFVLMQAANKMLNKNSGDLLPTKNRDLQEILKGLAGGIEKNARKEKEGESGEKKKSDNPYGELEDIFK